MTILLKKTTKKPNALKQKRIHLRQKSTEWSCGDTGHLAFPKGGLSPLRGSGVHTGDTGSSSGSSSSIVACPQRQGAEATAQILNFGALPRGLQAHFWSHSIAVAWARQSKYHKYIFCKNLLMPGCKEQIDLSNGPGPWTKPHM